MDSVRSWIAPLLTRALDEHLEITDSKSLRVEDELSNFYIHCDVVEFVQLVEVRASPCMQTDIPLSGKDAPYANFLITAADEVLYKYVAWLTGHSGSPPWATSQLLSLIPRPLFVQSSDRHHPASRHKAVRHPLCWTSNRGQLSA